MDSKFSLSMTSDELIAWLRLKDLHIDDCERIRKTRFNGRSFVRLREDHFKELGIVLGSRLLLEQLIEEARKDVSGSSSTDSSSNEAARHAGGFSVRTLCRELETVTQWKKLGINLNVDSHVLDMIKRNHSQDVEAQKTALFEYLVKNCQTLQVSWESICDALQGYEGNLAEGLRRKYCTGGCLRSDSEPDVTVQEITRLGPSHIQIIQEVTYDARSKWKNLGIELGISPPTLDSIDTGCHGTPEDCYRNLLETWLRGDTPKPTIARLLESLKARTVGYGYLVTKIEEMNEARKEKLGYYLN